MPYPAEYWLNNTEGLQADVDTAKIYFEGLLYSYDQRILRKMTQPTLLGLDAGGRFILSLRPDSPPNLEAIGRRAESLMKGSTGKTRTLLTAIQILCGTLRQFKNGQAPGCIPELLAAVIAQAWTTHPWAAADCETAVKAIFVRSKESTIIPERLEIAMFIYLANAYNAEGDVGRSMQCLIDARREASSDQNLQLIISHAYNNHLVIPLESNFPRFILPRMEDSRAPSDLKAAKTTDAGNSEGRLAGVESDDSGAAKTGATEVASERSGAKNDDGGSGDSNP